VQPRPGIDFDQAAAERGDALFIGKANCNSCHREPLWTEPGWNQHSADELKIDSFESDRSPGHAYRTMNLAGVFIRERGLFMQPQNKGRFYHDGRFKTLLDVVNSYDERFNLGLTDQEKRDLVEYLKSCKVVSPITTDKTPQNLPRRCEFLVRTTLRRKSQHIFIGRAELNVSFHRTYPPLSGKSQTGSSM
jgi:cytochrome c peroxidase